jgi:membrane associated rhomboid family serine protease
VNAGTEAVRRPRNQFGARVRAGAPVVTYVLIAVNVVMFALQTISHDVQSALVMHSPAVAGGELYRLLTSAFLHYGPLHLVFNMWALYVVGPPLEAALGRLRYTALYLLSALGGSVLVFLLASLGAATAGASGAVFGLFGAAFVVGRRLRVDVRWIVALIVVNLVITVVAPNISWQGHLGGLVTGAVVAAAYVYAPPTSRVAVQIGATVAVLAVFTALIWWRTVDLLTYFGVM